MQWPDIILLNGSSSAGKSTIAKALQNELLHPYLHFGFDDLILMMPNRYWQDSATPRQDQRNPWKDQGVHMIEKKIDDTISTEAKFGAVFRNVIQSMAPVVRTIVTGGTSVVFDHVIHDQLMLDSINEAFVDLNVLKVGVYCSLAELQLREKLRGDRVIGRARGLIDIVHKNMDYDITVDTSLNSIDECVNKIKDYIKNS
ncbi:hypothetical protein L3V82_06820 [Thiotrichales bacterium 19S3-7]|nr:hypothetical protein [Thiotrichales bacterium 19S3-7]MCF6801811.1 hypothetical protein [Thiotrichales bacterium 19S3-11]